MKYLFLRTIKKYSTLLLTGILFLNFACEDDDHDDHVHANEEHTDAEGFVLETESGTEVYKQLEGIVSTSNVSLAAGETLELVVHFLDHDGAKIEHDDGEHDEADEDELQVTVTSGAEFATVVVEEHDETGSTTEEHHEMALEITGLSAGTTNFSLKLMHGDHADFESAVDVVVTVTSGS